MTTQDTKDLRSLDTTREEESHRTTPRSMVAAPTGADFARHARLSPQINALRTAVVATCDVFGAVEADRGGGEQPSLQIITRKHLYSRRRALVECVTIRDNMSNMISRRLAQHRSDSCPRIQ